MNVCVIGGAGYVGLITGLCFAEIGHHVINVDVDRTRITELQTGKSHVYEEGIEPLLRSNLDEGRLSFTTDLKSAVRSSDIIFIAVGTPSLETGQADLSQISKVAEALADSINGYKILVIKSTVPAGTIELLSAILERKKQKGEDFDIAVNPEFLREGKGLYDCFNPDRIVIGSQSERANLIIKQLYEPILNREVSWPNQHPVEGISSAVPLVDTDIASAQMIKYASNAFLATQISFINEIAGVCEKVGADIDEVVRGMRHDPRIGQAYLKAGIGFGGPCLSKDLHSLINIVQGDDYDPLLFRAVVQRNERQVEEVISKVKHSLGHTLDKKVVAAFGLAFKAGTNDVRSSLALKALERLDQDGVIVQAYDPIAIPAARAVNPHLIYCEDPYQAVDGAEALLILTEWPSFRDLDYYQIKERMAALHIVDGRNLLDPGPLTALGFSYVGMGRS